MAESGSHFRKIRRRQKIIGLLRLLRLPNLLLILLGQLLVVFRFSCFGSGAENLVSLKMLLLLFVSMSSAAGGYIINDYHDVKIDQINKPARVIIGRLVTRRKALFSYVLLNLVAFCAAGFLGKKVLLAVLSSSVLLWLYSVRLKCIPLLGNLVVAGLVAWSLSIPSMLFPIEEARLFYFIFFAFLANLIRELVKDLEDRRGDSEHGCKTFAGTFSLPANRQLVNLLCGTLALLLLVSVFQAAGYWRWAGLLMFFPFVPFLLRLQTADRKKDFHSLSKMLKRIMLIGTAGMLLA